jgi:hypothetical protein
LHASAPVPAEEETMSGIEVKPPALERVGPQRGKLRKAWSAFQDASGSTEQSRDAWVSSVSLALAGLGEAWEEHVEFTEAPDGLFAELLDDSVEVASEVDHLRRDHSVVSNAMARAVELLAAPSASPDDATLSQSLSGIAKLVEQHRRRGSELLYRVYSVDTSAGD